MKKLAILFILLLTACGTQSGGNSQEGSADLKSITLNIGGDSNTPVAEINGIPVTEKELNQQISNQLTRIKSQIFDLQRQGISQIIDNRLLEQAAKEEKTTVPALLKEEINDKVGEISDKEVKDFYDKNKRRFGGRSFSQVEDNLKRQLFARKAMVYRNNYLDRLKEDADIKIFLTRPKIEVSVDDDPMKGNKNAKVTIIEFTDYQCPFCGRARPTINQVLDTYGKKVHYVLRDFPLDFHPQAKKASEAAHCAGDQEMYWEYSDILWKNQRALDEANLKKYAKQLKLVQEEFDQCLDSGKYTKEVEKDMADGVKAGVTGTPSFFINGQMLTGARPFEQFKEIIDLEIQTGKGKKS